MTGFPDARENSTYGVFQSRDRQSAVNEGKSLVSERLGSAVDGERARSVDLSLVLSRSCRKDKAEASVPGFLALACRERSDSWSSFVTLLLVCLKGLALTGTGNESALVDQSRDEKATDGVTERRCTARFGEVKSLVGPWSG